MLAEAGQTPTNNWHVSCVAAVKSAAACVKHTSWLPHTQHGRPSQTVILKQYFQLNRTVSVSVSHPGTKHQLHLPFSTLGLTFTPSENNIQSIYGQMTSCY